MMDYLFKKLTENIKSHSNIVIMTHKHPDLDGMGSAIALSKIVESFKKDCFIVYPDDKVTISLEKAVKLLKENNIDIHFRNYSEVLDIINENTLLIILDTQKPMLVQNSELLDKVKDIFVIDHHTNSSEHISNTVFEYINSNKSSIVEIITEYLVYLNKTLNPIIITIMSAGMEVDTHSYSLKTTENTFKMAGILTRLGADPILRKEMLKESRDDAIKRNDHIKNSYFIRDGYLLCDMGKDVKDNVDLAILADELLRFDSVEVSFAIGKLNNGKVCVSARSMGKVSAAVLMSAIGGGGHVTDAAAQFTDKSNAEVIEMIKKVVMEG
ncbi:MAG: hypothetical protein HFH47_00290 [Bacilli bacterium]|nr:hypothetical protein [Bacilli bacterium]